MPTIGALRWTRAERPVESGVAEGEHPAVGRDEPVAVPGRRRRDADDRLVQVHGAERAVERRVAVGEHASVGADDPVAVPRRGGGHADDRRRRDRGRELGCAALVAQDAGPRSRCGSQGRRASRRCRPRSTAAGRERGEVGVRPAVRHEATARADADRGGLAAGREREHAGTAGSAQWNNDHSMRSIGASRPGANDTVWVAVSGLCRSSCTSRRHPARPMP